jgi:hypothetical protein
MRLKLIERIVLCKYFTDFQVTVDYQDIINPPDYDEPFDSADYHLVLSNSDKEQNHYLYRVTVNLCRKSLMLDIASFVLVSFPMTTLDFVQRHLLKSSL